MWTKDETQFFELPQKAKTKSQFVRLFQSGGNERHRLGGHTCGGSVYTLRLCRFGVAMQNRDV